MRDRWFPFHYSWGLSSASFPMELVSGFLSSCRCTNFLLTDMKRNVANAYVYSTVTIMLLPRFEPRLSSPQHSHCINRRLNSYRFQTQFKIIYKILWHAYSLLGNGSLNTFQQKQTSGTRGRLLLGNGAVNTPREQYRLVSVWSTVRRRDEVEKRTVVEWSEE
jgi:hypothetical protein